MIDFLRRTRRTRRKIHRAGVNGLTIIAGLIFTIGLAVDYDRPVDWGVYLAFMVPAVSWLCLVCYANYYVASRKGDRRK